MHVALVSQWYPPDTGGGGVAAHNLHFARACARLGHKITVISSAGKNGASGVKVTDGVKIIRVPYLTLNKYHVLPIIGRQFRFVQALIYAWEVRRALEKLQREDPIDIVEFADVNAEGFFWKSGLGKQLVVRCQTPAFVLGRYYTKRESPYDPMLLGWMEKRTIRRAALLGAPSNSMALEISTACNIPVERFHVTPDALDTAWFAPAETKPASNEFTILFVGRLERQKGIKTLVEAIPAVLARMSNARFVIAGSNRPNPDGKTYRDYVKTELAEYIASGRVEVNGFVPDDQLVKLYHRADLIVVPSLLYESFSFACAQAMACGVPVIASCVGGIPETLAHGECGVLIDPGDVEALVDAILSLACNPQQRQRLAKAGRARAAAYFSAEVVTREILQSYETIL